MNSLLIQLQETHGHPEKGSFSSIKKSLGVYSKLCEEDYAQKIANGEFDVSNKSKTPLERMAAAVNYHNTVINVITQKMSGFTFAAFAEIIGHIKKIVTELAPHADEMTQQLKAIVDPPKKTT